MINHFKELHSYIEQHIDKIGYNPEMFLEESDPVKQSPIIKVIEGYKDKVKIYFSKEKPVTNEEITKAEKKLDLKFPQEYIDLLKNYNYISLGGYEIFGISRDKKDKYLDVVENTLENRKFNPNFPPKHFVIESIGIESIITLMNEKGKVYTYQNNGRNNNLQFESTSLSSFLRKVCNRTMKAFKEKDKKE